MSNIANVNTPGFQRRSVRFEDLMKDAIDHGRDLAKVAPKIELDTITPPRADGNNTNLELEMNSLRQNRLLYESYATILSAKFDLIRTAIGGSA